ncbi:MAG: UDP-N-acetylmuramoyl-L-alanine--D-glutamate ligase, partial [Chloroflexi bacterium]|nr:UDP-N-acetylmuramoyl-L-alanine--D-glutamate ligase [Chloroflexota bacterium]
IEGLALTRYLVGRGAQVTVSDAKSVEQLGDNLRQLEGLPVRLALGGNRPDDIADADIVFVSQGVPLDLPAVQAARERGVPLSSVTRLFMELCPAPIVGITGSAGKSTTTALTGEIFRAAFGPDRVHVGGNLGPMPLEHIEAIRPDHWVVLEISHTQLELTDRSPHAAAVTNISPSHMDRYPTMAEYIALKQRIYAYQGTGDVLVLNADDPVTRGMAAGAAAQVRFFSMREELDGDGTFLRGQEVVLRRRGKEQRLLLRGDIQLRGEHNVANVLTACALAGACGIPAEVMARTVRAFRGIEHRLEPVATVAGVEYMNDSIASTPERTIAGLRCFDRPLVLILGGRDKHLPLEGLVAEVGRRCTAAVVYGEAGPLLEAALRDLPDLRLVRTERFADAVQEAARLARPGDVVLLSPACTSFDQFPNFEARGRAFKRLVEELAPRRTGEA